MKLILSLSVLAVALLMVLEGPAPAQADSGFTEEVKKIWKTVESTLRDALDKAESTDFWKWFPDTFDKAKQSIKNKFS